VGRVAKRYISISYGIDWWPSQNENEFGHTAMDPMVGHALAEQSLFEDTYEDFPLPLAETVEEQNKPVEKESKIGILSNSETIRRVMSSSAQESLFPCRRVQEVSPRIHVLGAGSFGRFVAHALAGIGDPPPITLLSNRKDLIRHWDDEGRKVELITGNTSCPRSGIDVSHVTMLGPQADTNAKAIDKLIVTVKATTTVPALLAIKERLLPSSTICFLQNGMGIMEDVNTRVFPNPAMRPRYMVGVTSHITSDQRGRVFTTIQTKPGHTYLSLVPQALGLPHPKTIIGAREIDEKPLVQRMYYGWTASSRKLMKSLNQCTILNAKGFRYEEMLQLQFERLAVNAVLGPLSVVFDCPHGKLLENFAVTRLMRRLLGEIVAVAQSVPELRKLDHFKDQFTLERLESLIVRIASRSNNTLGSMLEDVRKGRQTDIDFINGYIVKRGQELRVPCPVNTTVIQMVKAKQAMTRNKVASFIPFKDS
jgi:2-dehydropantoate 2-reductase